MPPVSRFGGGARATKKQNVIDKFKVFFEKYYGLGIAELRAVEQAQVTDYKSESTYLMVAEEQATYEK